MKAYQAMQRAAADVADGKTGAKAKLKTAQKRYTDLVAKNAKKEADTKVKEAKARAAKIGSVKPKPKSATSKKKTTSKRRTSRSTTTKKRR
jgi:hypothetical protein